MGSLRRAQLQHLEIATFVVRMRAMSSSIVMVVSVRLVVVTLLGLYLCLGLSLERKA